MTAFYRLSRAARSLRRRSTFVPTTDTYFRYAPLSNPNVSPHTIRHLFEFSESLHTINGFYNYNNSVQSIGAYHQLVHYTCYSTVASNQKGEKPKKSSGSEVDCSWIDVYLPENARPYARLARLDKPIGTWLLAWPCMWSITMAATSGSLPDIKMMMLFGTGALLLRGAGCTINDLLDRDIDTKDKEDDLRVGVKSTALRFGDSTKEWIAGFGMACIGSLALSGFNANLEWPYYTSLAAASAHLAWQISTVDLSSRADCNRKFVSNKWFGAIVCSGILFGRLFS